MQLDSSIKYLFPQHLLCAREESLPTLCLNMNIVYKVHAWESSRYNFSVWVSVLAVCLCVCVCVCVCAGTDEWVHTNVRTGHAHRWVLFFFLLSYITELNTLYCTSNNWGHAGLHIAMCISINLKFISLSPWLSRRFQQMGGNQTPLWMREMMSNDCCVYCCALWTRYAFYEFSGEM